MWEDGCLVWLTSDLCGIKNIIFLPVQRRMWEDGCLVWLASDLCGIKNIIFLPVQRRMWEDGCLVWLTSDLCWYKERPQERGRITPKSWRLQHAAGPHLLYSHSLNHFIFMHGSKLSDFSCLYLLFLKDSILSIILFLCMVPSLVTFLVYIYYF